MILWIILIAAGYLMGSVCSAVIVCRIFNLPDPRTEGSNNPGATNVLRIAGKQYAALVMLADILKGTIPVLIAKALGADAAVAAFVALAAVIGHVYPIFFGFNGGKGVATAIGALLGLHLIIGVMVIATWLLVAKFSRYSSLASLVSITLAPLYSLLIIQQLELFPPLLFMVILIVFKHKNNITRLIDGVEPKINFKQHSVIEEIMDHSPNTSSSGHEYHATPKEEPVTAHKKTVPKVKKSPSVKKKIIEVPAKKSTATKHPKKPKD